LAAPAPASNSSAQIKQLAAPAKNTSQAQKAEVSKKNATSLTVKPTNSSSAQVATAPSKNSSALATPTAAHAETPSKLKNSTASTAALGEIDSSLASSAPNATAAVEIDADAEAFEAKTKALQVPALPMEQEKVQTNADAYAEKTAELLSKTSEINTEVVNASHHQHDDKHKETTALATESDME